MANASGEIFHLDADAGFDEGIVAGRVGPGARLSFAAHAEVCHGIDLALEANLRAEIEAALDLLYLFAVRANGAAYARAGVRGQVNVDINLFEKAGASAVIEATAEAALAGRLGVGLDFTAISGLIRDRVEDQLLAEIALAFLRELDLGGGVWGRAAFSAMAGAHLEATLRMQGDDGALVVEAGAQVGLAAGTGWDFYLGGGIENPRRFVATAAELVARRTADELRRVLPPELHPAVEFVPLTLPVALQSAYELGSRAALGTLGTPEAMVEPFLRAAADSLQRLVLDMAMRAADALLAELTENLSKVLLVGGIDADSRSWVATKVETLADLLEDGRIAVDDWPLVVEPILEIAEALGQADAWRPPLALAWAASVAFQATLDIDHAAASASASFLGFSTRASGGIRRMPAAAPEPILREIRDRLGRPELDNVSFDVAVDYLAASTVLPLLDQHLPDVAALLHALRETFQVSTGELAETALRAVAGGNLSSLTLYRRLRDTIRSQTETHVLGQLRNAIEDESEAARLMDEVARPSLRILLDFLFERLDALIGDPDAVDWSPFLESLAQGASLALARVVVRSGVVVGDLVLDHARTDLSRAFAELADAVRADRDHPLAQAACTLAPLQLPGHPVSPAYAEATRGLLGALLEVSAEIYGPGIYTEERRARQRRLLIELSLAVDGAVDWSRDPDALRNLLATVTECSFLAGQPAIDGLIAVNTEILADQAEIALERLVEPLARWTLAVSQPFVDALEQTVTGFLDQLERTWNETRARLQAANADLQDLDRQLQELAGDLEQVLNDIAEQLRDSGQQRLAVDRVRLIGRTNLQSSLAALGAPDPVIAMALFGFDALFSLSRGVVEDAVAAGAEAIAGGADMLQGIVAGAADASAAVAALSDALTEAVVAAVPSGFADLFRVAVAGFPDQLPLDEAAIAAAAQEVLVTLGLRQKLEQAIGLQHRKTQAEADRDRQAGMVADLAARRDAGRAALDSQRGTGRSSIQFMSPAALTSGRGAFVYGPEVPLSLCIENARPSYVGQGAGRRVRVALNGTSLGWSTGDWVWNAASGTLRLTRTLTLTGAPLRPGLNLLEASVVDGTGRRRRQALAFVVDPEAPALTGSLVVAGDLSQFDAPGNDHRNLTHEWVAIEWRGRRPLQLAGWRLMDRGGIHVYRFEDVQLPSGQALKVYTGERAGGAGPLDVHWGRRSAVWNNDGDAAYLVDAAGVLRAEHVYHGAARSTASAEER